MVSIISIIERIFVFLLQEPLSKRTNLEQLGNMMEQLSFKDKEEQIEFNL